MEVSQKFKTFSSKINPKYRTSHCSFRTNPQVHPASGPARFFFEIMQMNSRCEERFPGELHEFAKDYLVDFLPGAIRSMGIHRKSDLVCRLVSYFPAEDMLHGRQRNLIYYFIITVIAITILALILSKILKRDSEGLEFRNCLLNAPI